MINKCACGSFYGGDSDKCSSCEKNKDMGKEFDILFVFATSNVQINKCSFPGVYSVESARSWLNSSKQFIDIGDKIINVNNVEMITIRESK